MDGNCNVERVIYKVEVTSQTTKETYIGLCDTVQGITQAHFPMNGIETQLNLANVWNLKDEKIQYNIKWCKIKHARSYSN